MNRRGQTLVLFAVTMLALVVMVGITLTIGMRVREKIELQTLADASAYSNAVVTARAHNQIAVWNRAQIAHMMTLAGVQSQISYSSWYVGMLKGTEYGGYATASAAFAICLATKFKKCCPTVRVAYRFARAFRGEYNKQAQNLLKVDQRMADAARAVQGVAGFYGSAGKTLYSLHRVDKLQGGLAGKVLELGTKRATNPGEYSQTNAAKLVSFNEIRGAAADSSSTPSIGMTNGSREDGFLRQRAVAIPPYPPVLASRNRSIVGFFPDGTGHFGRARHSPVESGDNQAWGDDDGSSGGIINISSSCPLPTGGWANAYVKSSAKEFPSDHRFSPSDRHRGNRDTVHDLASCKDERGRPCNSVWVGRQEFNINHTDAQKLKPDADGNSGEGGARQQWRQPVSMVGLQRDYSRRSKRDPWEFNFSLAVSDGSQTEVDLKKAAFGGSADKQQVLATGITYYHRHMQNAAQSWSEPPNFFNPYWRATLVPADIDGNGNLALAGGALGLGLKLAGFKGVQ
jgi:hypothetical protein